MKHRDMMLYQLYIQPQVSSVGPQNINITMRTPIVNFLERTPD